MLRKLGALQLSEPSTGAVLAHWFIRGVLLRCRCGTSGISRKPRPDLDMRKQSTLDPLERLQTPVDWLASPKCRDQVGGWAGGRVGGWAHCCPPHRVVAWLHQAMQVVAVAALKRLPPPAL